MGYSFLGHEPDHLVCCDLHECTIPDGMMYKRLNCGHSFHITCLQLRDPANSPFVPDRVMCPICHPLLEERIRELSTTLNRWVRKMVLPSNKRRNVLYFILTFFSPFYVGISQGMHCIATTVMMTTKTMMMTISQMTLREIAMRKRTKATKVNWKRCWQGFEHVLDHSSKNDLVS